MQMGAQVGLFLKHPLVLFAFLTLSGLIGFIISAAWKGFGFLNQPPQDKSHPAGADTQVLPLTECWEYRHERMLPKPQHRS